MRQYAKNYELKDNAKRLLTGRYGVMMAGLVIFIIASFLVTEAIEVLTSTIISFANAGNTFALIMNTLCSLLESFFNAFITMGFALMCLKIYTGRQVSAADIFCGFREEYLSKYAAVALLRAGITFLFSIPSSLFSRYYGDGSDLVLLCALIGIMIAEYIISIPLLLPLDLSCFLILDFDSKSAGEIIADSYRICRGHKCRFFALQCSLFPIYLLGILSCGIGFLWIVPYTMMVIAMFYIDLMNPEGNKQPEPDPYETGWENYR